MKKQPHEHRIKINLKKKKEKELEILKHASSTYMLICYCSFSWHAKVQCIIITNKNI